ncbi:MAG: cyclic nucleotide-binding domain-containing protein, partial [Pseudobdellovibrionaceae bacterium]
MKKPKVQSFEPGDTIFREGETGDCAYIIEEGRVQISIEKNGEPFPVSRLGAGEIFGEMSLLDGLSRSASVTALENCKLCIVSKEQLFDRIDTADPVVRLLISVLIKRMRVANAKAGSDHDSDKMDTTSASNEITALDEANAIERIRFESELQEAFEKQQFYLHYQPIVSMKTGELFGFEALCRWSSPARGHVNPGVFMETLENSSLIVGVGRWIHDQAMTDLEVL